ncbi:unnamed protein product, partial [Porites lobata]
MWDEDVVGIADQNKRLTAEEVLAAREEAQSRRRLLKTDLSLKKHFQPRLEVAEKYCQVIEAKDDLKYTELPEFFRGHFSRCYRIAENIVVYTSIHTMGDASLLAYVDVTYVGHKYEDAAREEKGKQ